MRELKFEYDVLIGDRIRAYDFEPMDGRVDRYVEGVVQRTSSEYGAKCFVINCDVDSICPKGSLGSRVGEEVFVPMEVSFMEYDSRITVIG